MALLLKLNDLRPQLDDIITEAKETFPEGEEDVKPIHESLDDLSAALSQTISLVEKHYSDELTMDRIEKDLRKRIAEDEIFQGIPEKDKEAIIEKVISDPDMNLITEDELKEYVTDELKNASSDELVTKSYSKNDIINLGDAVSEPEASERRKYETGMKVLRDMVETPTGREDALSHGIERLMEDPQARLHHINTYYGLTGATDDGEPT